MSRLLLDRLPLRTNLVERGTELDSVLCPICQLERENNIHLVFFMLNGSSNLGKGSFVARFADSNVLLSDGFVTMDYCQD